MLYEASTRIHAIHPSGLPLARSRPGGTGRHFGFPLMLPHPADQEPTTHARGGDRPRARTWNYTLNITSADPPIGSSLIRATSRRTVPGITALAAIADNVAG